VASWGRAEDGQLGHGDAEERTLPVLIGSLHDANITAVNCGADHTTAWTENKKMVYSWGW
jgi:alpha-tubulin suppressor-like RCC1 family protein